MASIYGSATVTLVAAAGSIYGGMTDRRNPLRNSACCLSPRATTTGPLPHVFLLPGSQNATSQQSIPTDLRGWCYQEDVLSPRLVRFSLNGMAWQCLGDNTNLDRARGLERLAQWKPYQWYLLWYAFIERYSNMQLTYPEDKLTAFSGIAATKCQANTYVAGVNKDDIWSGLMWTRDSNKVLTYPGRRYSVFVAPSWSWASLDVPVLFNEAKDKALRKLQVDRTFWDPKLHEFTAEHTALNDSGPVHKGVLDLTTNVLTATTSLDRPNIFCADRTEQSTGQQRLVSSTSKTFIGEVIYDIAAEAREGESFQCLLLHVSDVHTWNQTGIAGLGIAVRPSNDSFKEYRRVGYVEFTPAFAQLSKYKRFRIV